MRASSSASGQSGSASVAASDSRTHELGSRRRFGTKGSRTSGWTVRGWTLIPTIVLSALAGAVVVSALDDSPEPEVATEVRERTAIQQVAYPATDTLKPTEPVAAGHTSSSVARVVVKSGTRSRLGTGVVLRSGQTLATAAELVSGAERITVVFEVDDRRPAEVAGIDEATGLAVLRFDGSVRGPAVIGSTENLEPENAVNMLIGTGMTPLMAPTRLGTPQVADTLTAQPPRAQGVIGAAVLDPFGTLVGLVTHVDQGQAFIAPIEAASRVEADLSEFGFVREADLGIAVIDGSDGGAEVLEVAADGNAVDVLVPGEVITAFNGQVVDEVADIAEQLLDMDPGLLVTLEVLGADGPRTTYVTLGATPR